MTASATWSLSKALAATIQGDATILALLNAVKPVHSGKPPGGAALDYIVLLDSSESRWMHMNGQGGNEGGETLTIWTTDLSLRKGKLIYAELRRLLDGTTLALDGHTMVRGELRLVTTYTDDGNPPARATVVGYTVLSKVGA
ncbi:MAG: DUF3168 domain-containing protein [Gemmatimonadales bacterium]|nr:DUF3168 domain-containing protein [Gemmatimonadales bacterium]